MKKFKTRDYLKLLAYSFLCVLIFALLLFLPSKDVVPLSQNQQSQLMSMLGSLFYISYNDQYKIMGVPMKIDINERRKYFTEKGWQEYLMFIENQKTGLGKNKLSLNLHNSINSSTTPKPKKIKIYIEDKEHKILFEGDVTYAIGQGIKLGCNQADLILNGDLIIPDITNLETIKFDSWHAQIDNYNLSSVNDNCLFKK